ncbi:MAG: DUF3040 domain-containing protein [Streptosporangiaceae bacterium]
MALSMDEQRILEEMERNLAADDPRLASRLSAFGQQALHGPFLSQRAKTISGVLALTLIAAVTLVLFVLGPLARPHDKVPPTHTSANSPAAQTTKTTGARASGGS